MGLAAPAHATVLFAGVPTDNLEKFKVSDDGLLMPEVLTKMPVQAFHLHLEFRTPFMPTARDQARGNSGVYIQRRYEVQILDSFGLSGEHNECGGIYTVKKPDVNMCLPPLAWQTYDIDFKAAKFDESGKKTADARMTVKHNGVLIHNHFELLGITSYVEPPKYTAHAEKEPLQIQFHGNPVRFRNIWIRENIKPLIGLSPDPRPNTVNEPAQPRR